MVSSAEPPTAVNLSFLDWNRYFFFQVAPHLSSRDWVDPVPYPLLLKNLSAPVIEPGTAGSAARDLTARPRRLLLILSSHVQIGLIDIIFSRGLSVTILSAFLIPTYVPSQKIKLKHVIPHMVRHWIFIAEPWIQSRRVNVKFMIDSRTVSRVLFATHLSTLSAG
jgi:hypothetical protein